MLPSPYTKAYASRDWQAIINVLNGGRNCECLPREYHKKNYRGKHPQLRPQTISYTTACQSRHEKALVSYLLLDVTMQKF